MLRAFAFPASPGKRASRVIQSNLLLGLVPTLAGGHLYLLWLTLQPSFPLNGTTLHSIADIISIMLLERPRLMITVIPWVSHRSDRAVTTTPRYTSFIIHA